VANTDIVVWRKDTVTGFLKPLAFSSAGIDVNITGSINLPVTPLLPVGYGLGTSTINEVGNFSEDAFIVAHNSSGAQTTGGFTTRNAKSLFIGGTIVMGDVKTINFTVQASLDNINYDVILTSSVAAAGVIPTMRICTALVGDGATIAQDMVFPYYRMAFTTTSTSWGFDGIMGYSWS
jgi:hypothetical protein